MWIPPAYSPIRLAGILRGLVASTSEIPALEAKLAGWYGAERALATSSGTHALQLAIRCALDRQGGGGAVALPGYNCYDLISAAVWVGAPVVFYDLDPMTLGPDAGSLERAVGRAEVLVVANLFGFPLDWDLIRGVAGGRSIPVVEDAAQGMGAVWKGQPAGTLGDLSVLSFGRGKGWTGGSGGCVMARNGFGASLPETLPDSPGSRWIEAAKAAMVWLLARPTLYGIPARMPGLGLGETHYRSPTDPGRITPFAAAMVSAGRARSLAEVAVRRSKAHCLRRELGVPGVEASLPAPVGEGESGDLRMPILLPRRKPEHERFGVYAGYPLTLPELEEAGPLAETPSEVPGARRLSRELVTGPTHSRTKRGLEVAIRNAMME